MEHEILIDQLKANETKFSALEIIKEIQPLPDSIKFSLIEAGINERDPGANGYFLQPILKQTPLIELRNLILEYFYKNNFPEQVGALKLLYHVRKEILYLDNELDKFIEDPDAEAENKQEWTDRKDKLIPAYNKCDNPVLRFFFQWALPGEECIRNEQPETLDDLWNDIKHLKKYSEMLTEIYPEYKQENVT